MGRGGVRDGVLPACGRDQVIGRQRQPRDHQISVREGTQVVDDVWTAAACALPLGLLSRLSFVPSCRVVTVMFGYAWPVRICMCLLDEYPNCGCHLLQAVNSMSCQTCPMPGVVRSEYY